MLYGGESLPPAISVFLRQATHLITEDLLPPEEDAEPFFRAVHDRLARELGGFALARGTTYIERCARFLGEPFDLWNDTHRSPDWFFKSRLSLVELAFQSAGQQVEAAEAVRHTAQKRTGGLLKLRPGTKAKRSESPTISPKRACYDAAVEELNVRLRSAKLPLHYHAGLIQFADDTLSTREIVEPFWGLLGGPEWRNVDADMKEAIHRRDTNGRDAALYALKALESAVKVVSGKKGWTRGTEKGAANYIDNLVSAKNGRFIDVWEADTLKGLFQAVRNPLGHGPGDQDPLELSSPQQTWVIESAMSWIKSIVRRL